MNASNWINLGLLVVAVVAAVFAAFQVVEARKAMSDARDAREAAKGYELAALSASEKAANSAEDSADSQRRIAHAIEEQARLAKEQTERTKAWLFEATTDADGNQLWTVRNNTGGWHFLHLSLDDEENARWIVRNDPLPMDLENGAKGAFTLQNRHDPEVPKSIRVIATWYEGETEMKQFEDLR